MATLKKDLKKKYKKAFIRQIVLFAILCLYIGLQIGASYQSLIVNPAEDMMGEATTYMDAILHLTDQITAHPFWPFPTHFTGVMMMLLAWLIFLCYRYTDYIRKYNTMYENAHGSGGFNEDLPEYYRNYVCDPKIAGGKTYKNKEAKKLIKAQIFPDGMPGWMRFLSDKTHGKLPLNVLSNEKLQECKNAAKILSNDVYLSTNATWSRRNLNTFVLGASGTGKSRFVVKPNILQANSSYVVTDPSGEILRDCGGFLRSKGYQIKVLNLKDLSQSCRYNPMAYIGKQADIPVLVNCMMQNIGGTEGKGGGGNDKFWTQSTRALLTACVAYLYEVYTDDDEYLDDGTPNSHWKGHCNFLNVMRMLRMAEIHEDEGATISDLDRLFAELAEKNFASYAVRMYQTFKMAPDKTALNILISTAVELGTFFDNDDFANISYTDDMDIRNIGKVKTAVFIILPEGETTYNFWASMFYTQMFALLYDEGEHGKSAQGGGDPTLDIPVQIFLDEMANIGKIPEFNTKLATMRKYGISCTLIFQSQSQTKEYSEKGWETMIGNCDTLIYLGGAEPSTVKMLSERLGKMTVQTYSYGSSKSGGSDNRQQIARNVVDPNELEAMDNSEQIICIRGESPFCVKKYTYEQHPNYKYTAGSHKKEAITFDQHEFDIVYNESIVERTFVYLFGDPNHTEPKMIKKYEGKPLATDNFAYKLTQRAISLNKDKNAIITNWRDTFVAPKVIKDKRDIINNVPDRSAVAQFGNVNEADKKIIARKVEEITGRKLCNMDEDDFKQALNIDGEDADEQLVQWMYANGKIDGGYSPNYEFDDSNDFLIREEDDSDFSESTTNIEETVTYDVPEIPADQLPDDSDLPF